jgi:hypothetical protein
MTKGIESQKDNKKAPARNLKEKRAAKEAKRAEKNNKREL